MNLEAAFLIAQPDYIIAEENPDMNVHDSCCDVLTPQHHPLILDFEINFFTLLL
jgi:hypothetical protein